MSLLMVTSEGYPIKFAALKEELTKGNHFYEIPKLAEQVGRPPVVDGKTLVAVEVDPAVLDGYTGTYRISDTATFTVSVEGNRLFGRVRDGEGRATEIVLESIDEKSVGKRID